MAALRTRGGPVTALNASLNWILLLCFWMSHWFPAGVSGSQPSDCSYYGLLKYLNLTTPSQVMQIIRPVQSWNHTTAVSLDMVMYGILDVVSGSMKGSFCSVHSFYDLLANRSVWTKSRSGEDWLPLNPISPQT